MKLIKYDDWGKVISSKTTPIPEIEGAQKPVEAPELDIVEPLTRKRTIRGLIVGIILGFTFGALVEAFLLLKGNPWHGPLWGTVIFAATVVISTIAGYIQGSMIDRE